MNKRQKLVSVFLLLILPVLSGVSETKASPSSFYKTRLSRQNMGIIGGCEFFGQKQLPKTKKNKWTSIVYHYTKDNFPLKIVSTGQMKNTTHFFYDSNGRLISLKNIEQSRKTIKQELYSFQYDKKGKIKTAKITFSQNNQSNAKNSITGIARYSYDKKGRLIKNRFSFNSRNTDGVFKHPYMKYHYDKHDRLIKIYKHKIFTSQPSFLFTYKYDNTSKIIKEILLNPAYNRRFMMVPDSVYIY